MRADTKYSSVLPLSENYSGTSLGVQWLGHCASSAGGEYSIPAQGTKTHTGLPKKKIILFACLPHPLLSVSFVRAETFPQHLGQCLAQNK